MRLESGKTRAALRKKGFEESDGDHKTLVLVVGGRETRVSTKVSHGGGGRDITSGLVAKMAKQCHLSSEEFGRLVGCTLGRDDYLELLRGRGVVGDPDRR